MLIGGGSGSTVYTVFILFATLFSVFTRLKKLPYIIGVIKTWYNKECNLVSYIGYKFFLLWGAI